MGTLTKPGHDREEFDRELRRVTGERDLANQLLADTEEAAALALERQVTTAVDRLRTELTQQWETERSRLTADCDQANQLLADTEEAAALALERQITTAIERARTEFAALERLWNAERAQLANDLDRAHQSLDESKWEYLQALAETQRDLAVDVERVRAELTAEADKLRQELQQVVETSTQGDAERARLSSELNRADQLLEERKAEHLRGLSDAQRATAEKAEKYERELAVAVSRVRAELTAEADKLRQELQQVVETSTQGDAERARLSSELNRANQLLEERKAEHLRGLSDAQRATAEKAEKYERESAVAVNRVSAELTAEADKLRQELQQVVKTSTQRDAERAVLSSELNRANQLLEEGKAEHLRGLSDAERTTAEKYEKELAVAVERVRAELTAEADKLRQDLQRLTEAAAQWNVERARLAAERDQAATSAMCVPPQTQGELQEFEPLQNTEGIDPENARVFSAAMEPVVNAFERGMANAVELGRSELMEECERLRQELEELADFAVQQDSQRSRLNEECERAHRLLADAKLEQLRLLSEAEQTGAAAKSKVAEKPSVTEALQAEIVRVEALVQAISDLIDDPATDLSLVMRKNVERSDLESYLKGIRFSVSVRVANPGDARLAHK